MRSIVIRGHLGLGDHLICNGLVRVYAEQYDRVIVPCKRHNEPSVRQMFLDNPKIQPLPVDDDAEADKVSGLLEETGSDLIKLGMFGERPFDITRFDSEMYRQAGVPFIKRWNRFEFKLPEDPVDPPLCDYAFVHDDPSRGFRIDVRRLSKMKIIKPSHVGTIFHWLPTIFGAKEISCVDSCFAILVDSLTLHDFKVPLLLHLYARRDKPPHYRKQWEVLE